MKLVPVVFAHMCCGPTYVFGQSANGDNYRRRQDAPGSQAWEPVVPALGPATKRRSKTRRVRNRSKRNRPESR